MINHYRTLLLNRSREGRPAYGVYGEELIPAEYAPAQETTALQRVRATLLGTDGDALYENVRLAQYMTLLHAHQAFAEYVTGADSRITYVPGAWPFYDVGQQITVQGPTDPIGLTTYGLPLAEGVVGQCLFLLRVTTDIYPLITVTSKAGARWTKTLEVSVADGVSSRFDLLPGLSAQFMLAPGGWVIGSGWDITAVTARVPSLATVLANLKSRAGVEIAQLVERADDTVKDLWLHGHGLTDQLAAGLVAYVLEMERQYGLSA